MKTLVIITGHELRHEFLRKYLAVQPGIAVIKTYCEVPPQASVANNPDPGDRHFQLRAQTERDFFGLFCDNIPDRSNPEFLPKGMINSTEKVAEIVALNPDLIVSYGCSIIKPLLIAHFEGRFMNLHLGLSPYYRGSGTNFFPFVNGEPQFTGVTFMHIDQGIDTGPIIHQIRARISPGDNIHQIGNRLIGDMARTAALLIGRFDSLEVMTPLPFDPAAARYYRKADFTPDALAQMYQHFSGGLIDDYLANQQYFDAQAPILQNKALSNHA